MHHGHGAGIVRFAEDDDVAGLGVHLGDVLVPGLVDGEAVRVREVRLVCGGAFEVSETGTGTASEESISHGCPIFPMFWWLAGSAEHLQPGATAAQVFAKTALTFLCAWGLHILWQVIAFLSV